jgi:uncharacterized membrane protein YciS (DUF1049 family)
MNDAAILVLNLTFLVTLGVALLMFLGNVVLVTAILLLAGAGHVLAFAVLLPFGRYRKNKLLGVGPLHAPGTGKAAILAAAFHSGIKARTERTKKKLPLTVKPEGPQRAG